MTSRLSSKKKTPEKMYGITLHGSCMGTRVVELQNLQKLLARYSDHKSQHGNI